MAKGIAKPKWNKVRWRTIMRHWPLNSYEKIFALTILSHSNSEGWANMAPIDIRQTSGGMDNRTQEKVIESLVKRKVLDVAESDNERKTLYRIRHYSE